MPDFSVLEGKVARIFPSGSAEFDAEREDLIWNQRLAHARTPAAIAEIASADQASAAIRFARENGLTVTVRGHGHNYEAASLRDGTLMLDVARMNTIELDLESGTAWAGAGVSGGALLDTLEPQGLAFPIGHCSNVPLSGYVLSGGFGWNAGEWGPATANVLAMDVVTAAGDYLRVDAENHADLFWALRGVGSGAFAAVLRYCIALHPLPRASFTWSATFPIAEAERVAEWLTDATGCADRSAEIICLVGPDHQSGKPAIIVRASATGSSGEKARAKVADFRHPPREVDYISEPAEEFPDFAELTRLSAMPNGKRVYADHLWSNGSLGDMLRAVQHLAAIPDKSSSINLFSPGGGGVVPNCADDSCALSLGGGAGVGIYAMWDEPDDDERHIGWAREVDRALAPFRAGRYIGEANLGAGPDRLAECFASGVLERIERLRAQWDPDGLFKSFPVPDET